LPTYHFEHRLQIALLDGPHGYPFPDLEYFYLYPQMDCGGLLLVDDIKIPSIRRMFDILKEEPMFRLLEVADHNLAVFQRTEAPLLDPTADYWWLQGYNAPYYAEIMRDSPLSTTSVRMVQSSRPSERSRAGREPERTVLRVLASAVLRRLKKRNQLSVE
jgi:hypothetical protein